MTDPTTVTTDQLTAALESWGIDTKDVLDIDIQADARGGSVQVRRVRRGVDGAPLSAGGGPATVTTVIGITRPASDDPERDR